MPFYVFSPCCFLRGAGVKMIDDVWHQIVEFLYSILHFLFGWL